MKGSLWAVITCFALAAILFGAGNTANVGNTTNASQAVGNVTAPLSGPVIGLGLFAMAVFFVGALALSGGGRW